MSKIIITAALTGSLPTKKHTKHIPITPDEIAESAYRCYNAGASIVHLHARDACGKPTSEPAVFAEIVEKVREKAPMLIINISTGGRGRGQEERGSALYLKPELASLTTGSVNFPDAVYANPPQLIEFLAGEMQKYNVKPECEIFDSAMIPSAVELEKKGIISAPLYFNFVMGLKNAIPAGEKYLLRFIEDIPAGSLWGVSGVGKHQLEMNALGIKYGGNVRTGLEDNLYYEKGVLATNEMLVERVVALANQYGRTPANPDEARDILSLRRIDSKYGKDTN